MSKPKTKMRFNRDMFYNDPNVPIYKSGVVYEIEENMVFRWLKRGGEIVEDKVPTKVESKGANKNQKPSETKAGDELPVEAETEKSEDDDVKSDRQKNSPPVKSGSRK